MMHEPFTDEEFLEMVRLIRRYTETDMDQFDLFRLDSKWGPVFVSIVRGLAADAAEEAYRTIRV